MTWDAGEITYPLGDGYELGMLRAEYNPAWGILYDPWNRQYLALHLATDVLQVAGSAPDLREQMDTHERNRP